VSGHHGLAEDKGFELAGLTVRFRVGVMIVTLSSLCRRLVGLLCYNSCYKMAGVAIIRY